jgi:hypothetical protein
MSKLTIHMGLISAAVFVLSACGDKTSLEEVENSAAKDAALEGKIECALAGKLEFARVCTAERVTGPEGQMVVLRNPDGGFRRFTILGGGKGLEPADGFDDSFAIKLIGQDMIEVKSGDDIYRLPAAIKPSAPDAGVESEAAPTDKAG